MPYVKDEPIRQGFPQTPRFCSRLVLAEVVRLRLRWTRSSNLLRALLQQRRGEGHQIPLFAGGFAE